MVQLRSDRWYSRSGQRKITSRQKTGVKGTRRLISLVLLLVMVVWVMKKSADPEVFERAFRQLGVPLAAETKGPRTFLSQSDGRNSASAPQKPQEENGGGEVTTASDPSPQSKSESSSDSSDAGSFFEGVWGSLPWVSGDLGLAAEAAFGGGANKSSGEGGEGADRPKSPADRTWSSNDIQLAVEIALTENREEFTKWLDRRLLGDLTDGSPWRGTENTIFYRLLQKTSVGPEASAELLPVTSYPALKESLAKSRGTKWTRFRGTIERVKQVSVRKPQLGIQSYWSVWLRPSDGSAYPVVVYLTRLPESIKNEPLDQVKGELEVYGLPAKLVAYNSAGGVEIAPSLCGIASDYWVPDAAYARTQATAGNKPTDGLWAVGIAACIACVVVTWIWRRTQNAPQIEEAAADAEQKKKESKRLKFQLGKGKSPSNTAVGLLWIALVWNAPVHSLQAMSPQEVSASQETEAAENEKAFALLNARLTDEAITEIEQFAINESLDNIPFPNSLGRVLFLLDQMGRAQLANLTKRNPETGVKWRATSWSGWVVGCDLIKLNDTQKEWMEQAYVYRLRVHVGGLEGSADETFLFVRRAPSQWLNQEVINQPFTAKVLQLTDGWYAGTETFRRNDVLEEDAPSSSSVKIGITADVQWMFSDDLRVNAITPDLPTDWKRMLLSGSDLTWLDRARLRQNASLSYADRESFYSLLRIAKEFRKPADTDKLGPVTWAKLSETDLLTSAQAKWIGRAIEVKGRIARITRLAIDSQESQEMAGAKFYYELDGFIRMEGKRIVIAPPKDVEQNSEDVRTQDLVYENEFPFTVVTLDLPEFLTKGLVDRDGVEHQSWELQRWVDVRGIYFRNWSYRSDFVSRENSRERQMAPLIVAAELLPTEFEYPINTSPSQYLSWGIVVAILFLTIVGARFLLSDRRSKKRKRTTLPAK